MKKIIQVILLGIILLAGCNSDKKEKAEALFTDPVMEDEIFNAILNDSARLHDFFKKLDIHHIRHMRTVHQRMMNKMCCSDMDSMMCDASMKEKMMHHMLRQCDRDSMFCMQMGDSVMQHDRLRRHLQQRMAPGQEKRRNR